MYQNCNAIKFKQQFVKVIFLSKHVRVSFSVLKCSIECHKRCVVCIWYSAGMCSALNAADVQDTRSPAVQTRILGFDLLVLKGHDLRNTPMPFKCVFFSTFLFVGTQTHIKTQAYSKHIRVPQRW